MSAQEACLPIQSEGETVNSFLAFLDTLKDDVQNRIQTDQKVEMSNLDLTEGITSSLFIKENFEQHIEKIFAQYKYNYVTNSDLKGVINKIIIDPSFNTCSFITVHNPRLSTNNLVEAGLKSEIETISGGKLKLNSSLSHIFACLPVLTHSSSFYFSQVHCLYNVNQCIYYNAPPCCLYSFHSIIRLLSRSNMAPDEILFQLAAWDAFLTALSKEASRLASKEIVISAGDSLFLGRIVDDSPYFEVTSLRYTQRNTSNFLRPTNTYEEASAVAEKEGAEGILLTTAIGMNEIKKSHLQIALHKRLQKLFNSFGDKPTKELVDEYIDIHTEFTKRGVIRRF